MEALIEGYTLIEVLFEWHCNSKFGQNFEMLKINNTFSSGNHPGFVSFWIYYVQHVFLNDFIFFHKVQQISFNNWSEQGESIPWPKHDHIL